MQPGRIRRPRPRQQHQQSHDEKPNPEPTSQFDKTYQFHFALVRHAHGRDIPDRIGHDRKQDQTHETPWIVFLEYGDSPVNDSSGETPARKSMVAKYRVVPDRTWCPRMVPREQCHIRIPPCTQDMVIGGRTSSTTTTLHGVLGLLQFQPPCTALPRQRASMRCATPRHYSQSHLPAISSSS